MNLAQAKSKLAEASRSTGTKHAKILIADLCSVVKFLLDEIEKLGTPVTAVLRSRNTNPDRLVGPGEPTQPPWPDQPPNLPDRARTPPTRYTTSNPPPLNAGDVE